MSEETRKYIEHLREEFKRECNGPSDLKRRQELLTNARHAILISDEDFTKVEMGYVAFEANSSFGYGFYVGARWADEHQKSPWISPDNSLPAPGEKVLICVNSNSRSTATINPRPYHFEISERLLSAELGRLKRKGRCPCDKYGFPNHGYDTFEVLYWMPLPEMPKGGKL